MKNLNELTVEHITKQFNLNKLDGAGRLTPRNGYYHVLSFEYRNVNGRADVPIIKAIWKLNHTDLFIDGVVVEIAVSSLAPATPRVNIDFSTIAGKTLHVFDMVLSRQIINGKEVAKVNGKWLYEFYEHQIFNRFTLFMQSLSNEIITTQDGKVKIASDEIYGIDYQEEAERQESFLEYNGDDEDETDANSTIA